MSNFAERIRELRKERGLKQREMAEIPRSPAWFSWLTTSVSAWTT